MKSASEYLEHHLQKNEFGGFIYTQYGLLSAIRQAQKDAITLCAQKATTTTESDYGRDGELYDFNVVDKESILSLINEVK